MGLLRSPWSDFDTTTWEELANLTWRRVLYSRPQPDIALDSLEISDDINHRATGSFTVLDPGNSLVFYAGQPVEIFTDNKLVFAGIIDSVTMRLLGQAGSWKEIELSLTDYTVLAERRIFSYAHDGEILAGEIVRYILSNILASEGVEEGEIQSGAELPRATFAFKTCAEVLDTLASISGYIWFIDYDRRLYFIERSTFSSEFDISDYSKISEFEVTEANPLYRNVQYLVGAEVRTQELTEYFRGNGDQKSFAVGYPLASEPTVYVNGVIQDVGIKGVESGKDWYWNLGDPIITQDPSAQPLSEEDILRVDYIGKFPLVIKLTSYSETTLRRLVEGTGTGRYERIDSHKGASDFDQALEIARGLLAEYGTFGYQVRYVTREQISSGSLQHIALPEFGLDLDFLITSSRISFRDGEIFYEVTACSGPIDPSWEDIFCRIAKNARERYLETTSESEVVQGLEEFSKIWQWDDYPNPFRSVYADGSQTPSSQYVPCFAEGDRFTHCVLYSNGVEFFRKPITYQEDDEETLTSIVIINANEANRVPISHVALWGGDSCSSTPGSGVELAKFSFEKTKSQLETIQLNFYDVRGWV